MPSIATRQQDERQQTAWLVEIALTPSLLFTNFPTSLQSGYPNGITVSGKTYIYRDVAVGSSRQSVDGAQPTLAVTLGNADNALTPLGSDPTKRSTILIVQRLNFNEDWTISGAEPWFIGTVTRPRIVGPRIQLSARRYMGRKGQSPRIQMRDALITHLPPDPEVKLKFSS